MAILYQVVSSILLCNICGSVGIMFTWPSSTFTLFSSENTTLHRPMRESEISLLGSLSSFGAMCSIPVAAYFLDKVGRKKCAICSSCTSVLGWIMIATCNRVEVVLAAVYASGLCSNIIMINTVYVGEMCQESIKGAAAAGIMVFYGMGMLFSYGLGGIMEYWTMVYINLTISILATIGLLFMKESPIYLLAKGFDKEAREVVAFLRSADVYSQEVDNAIEGLQRALNPELDSEPLKKPTPEEEKLNPQTDQTKPEKEKLSIIKFFKRSQSTRRAFFVCFVLTWSSVFQGLPVVQMYAEPLFMEAIPTISSTLCTVLFALAVVLSGFLGGYLVQTVGRRRPMIYGSLVATVCNLLLGSQIQFHWGPNWLTAVIMYIFCLSYIVGVGTVPFVLIIDVFLPEVKSFTNMILIEWMWFCSFLLLFIFNPLISAIGLGPVFYMFSVCCLFTAVFCYFLQPETKGLPVDEVQVLFMSKKRRQQKGLA